MLNSYESFRHECWSFSFIECFFSVFTWSAVTILDLIPTNSYEHDTIDVVIKLLTNTYISHLIDDIFWLRRQMAPICRWLRLLSTSKNSSNNISRIIVTIRWASISYVIISRWNCLMDGFNAHGSTWVITGRTNKASMKPYKKVQYYPSTVRSNT